MTYNWTPLEVRPLHTGATPEQRWACFHPQQKIDRRTVFDYRCRACCERALSARPTHLHVLALFGPLDQPTTAIVSVRRAVTEALRDLHGVDA